MDPHEQQPGVSPGTAPQLEAIHTPPHLTRLPFLPPAPSAQIRAVFPIVNDLQMYIADMKSAGILRRESGQWTVTRQLMFACAENIDMLSHVIWELGFWLKHSGVQILCAADPAESLQVATRTAHAMFAPYKQCPDAPRLNPTVTMVEDVRAISGGRGMHVTINPSRLSSGATAGTNWCRGKAVAVVADAVLTPDDFQRMTAIVHHLRANLGARTVDVVALFGDTSQMVGDMPLTAVIALADLSR